MRQEISVAVSKAESLDQVANGLIHLFEETLKINPLARIWYVPGIISSDGEAFIARNLLVLSQMTEHVRTQFGRYVFSASDVFNQELFSKIDANTPEPRNPKYMDMWRRVLGSGFVYGVVMTPRWQISKGATDEYETALKHNLEIKHISASGIITG